MQNSKLVVILLFTITAYLTVSPQSYCYDVNMLKEHVEECGRECFNIIYTANHKESYCRFHKAFSSEKSDFMGLQGIQQAKSFAVKCIEQYAVEQTEPWLWQVLHCAEQKAAVERLRGNPNDNVAKETYNLMMVNKFQCDPLPSPEEALREHQIYNDSMKKPNLKNPNDGSKIVWAITKANGEIGTIHLGISISDKSFWRYVHGSNQGAEPATAEEESQLNNLLNIWKETGYKSEYFAK